jgi:hypothetical protein
MMMIDDVFVANNIVVFIVLGCGREVFTSKKKSFRLIRVTRSRGVLVTDQQNI